MQQSLDHVTGSTEPDNITLTDGTGLGRRMASRANFGNINGNLNEIGTRTICGTYTWVQNQVPANYMSLGCDSGVADGNPLIVEAKPLQGAPMNPFVSVACQMAPSSEYIRNLSDLNSPYGNTPLASSYGPAGPFHEGTFDIRDLWSKAPSLLQIKHCSNGGNSSRIRMIRSLLPLYFRRQPRERIPVMSQCARSTFATIRLVCGLFRI